MRFAGEHGLIDRGGAGADGAVGWDLFPGKHHDDVSEMQVLDPDHGLGPIAHDPGFLGAKLEQFGDGARGLALRSRLEVTAEQDQRDDHSCGLEVDRETGEHRPHRIHPRGEGSNRHQGVHPQAAGGDLLPGRLVELPAESEHHDRGQGGLNQV